MMRFMMLAAFAVCTFSPATAAESQKDAQEVAQVLLALKSAPQEDVARARAYDDAASRLQVALPLSQIGEVARTRELAAALYLRAENKQEARTDLVQAIALRRSISDFGPEYFVALVKLGELDLAMNDVASAEREFDEALSRGKTLYGSDSSLLVPALAGEAEAAERLGHATDTATIRKRIEVLSATITPADQALTAGYRGPAGENAARLAYAPQSRYAARPGKGNFTVVRVFFGTDRNAFSSPQPQQVAFGSAHSGLSYGYVDVSIPATHDWGMLESPGVDLEGVINDPHLYILTLDGRQLQRNTFIDALHRDEDAAHWREAFVFVHGFNTTFDDAARRSAQLAYDLRFPGTPIFFSWPSAGGVLSYWQDEETIKQSAVPLAEFLRDLIVEGNFSRIHILAHSMGNRAVLEALAAIAAHPVAGNPRPFDQVIFAAPDVARDDFSRAIPVVAATAQRLTLYASATDFALSASELVNSTPRAGFGGEGMLVLPRLDSIDMTDVNTEFLGHSYYGDSPATMADIVQLTWHAIAPAHRCGMSAISASLPNGWRFSPDPCRDPAFLEATSVVKRWNEEAPARISAYLNSLGSAQNSERLRWTRILNLTKRLLATP